MATYLHANYHYHAVLTLFTQLLGWNFRYKAFGPFKKAYNNYRDDHDQFRQLIQASGVLEVLPDQIVVHLMPCVNYPPQLRASSPQCSTGSMPRTLFYLTAAVEA